MTTLSKDPTTATVEKLRLRCSTTTLRVFTHNHVQSRFKPRVVNVNANSLALVVLLAAITR